MDDHDHSQSRAEGGDNVSMAGSSSPEKSQTKLAEKPTKVKEDPSVNKAKGKSIGHHDHHHHLNGREKKAKIARAH
jgi:hypothetical protein